MKKIAILMILLLFTILGCGYTTRSLLSTDFKTVYVEPFRSKIDLTKEIEYSDHWRIYRPGLERELTKAVKERFIFDGGLKIVNSKESADSELVCEIIDFRKEPLQYTDTQRVDEYRLKIIISMKFTNLIKNEILVDEKEFVGETTYTLSGTFAKSESAAQKDAITDLTRRIVERVIENW